ncbi:histidine kinase [Sphaerisporangium siamense]|uniref:Circadian input-output histidine kinase CikA n=1 Tax=Sphaerisporangium siamense TaxID=795645 RepID=A0A7W7D2Q7_9ACTN|nr:HAMP domain-containing protein [Sphaerisporangium siamense]MBB4699163.1 signal transduction histidine kinase/HAMP domain-containing protein/ActR/RegA family two-component response regulator [Sphaerisporangium siamense]GII86710.1 histidine kinase [Sphaerisporangium siamense]
MKGTPTKEPGSERSYTESELRPLLETLITWRDGDFRRRVPHAPHGILSEIRLLVNEVADRREHLANELLRVRREVTKEGHFGVRLTPGPGVGSWAESVDSVNALIDALVGPVSSAADVLDAVAQGDLSRRIDMETTTSRGEVRRLGKAINGMVDQLSLFTSEVTRVAREVGSEGRLGGKANLRDMSGSWRDLTDAVNTMSSRVSAQVRDIAVVTTAVARGDLSRKVTVDAVGEMLELKNTVNTMVDQLSAFAEEVTRVAREVGTEGELGGQARVRGVSGVWKDLTDNVNVMAGNLTSQVRNIATVATAVAQGDLSKKITADAQGEILQLKETLNTMVDQLSMFADEVTRVAREVGTEGQLGGRADVKGVSGVWKDLTDNVNSMAYNLTYQVRNIAQVTKAVAGGDLSKKIDVDAQGEMLELKSTINTMVDQLSSVASEVSRVAREVGSEGQLGGQAQVRGVSGVWKDLTDNVNFMANNLTSQVRQIAAVSNAVVQGNLSRKITVDAQGEILQLKDTVNTMVDQLSLFADEVTRVAREVGTMGQLGGQARVRGVSGVWKDLTDNVNSMATNLTYQVRNIGEVTTAVARGDLSRKIDVDAQGEILVLKTTINRMVDQLSSFASEVTRVAREVASEGRLGGQARVEGVEGTWKQLTESVNELAGNLTTQVRAIAEVTSAVARGDLTRSISVEAQGELADLKDNINTMVSNLVASTKANQQQDWLKSNLARVSRLMQGHRDLQEVGKLIMSELTPLVQAHFGAFYMVSSPKDAELGLIAGYGVRPGNGARDRFAFGQGIVGQAAAEGRPIVLDRVPSDYLTIDTGLSSSTPAQIVVLPVLFEEQVLGVMELASFSEFGEVHLAFLNQLVETIGVTMNTIIANSRTEGLLAESQRLTTELRERSDELQRQQEELRRSNAELEDKAALLAKQNRAIEIQNFQIEQARRTLEERAEQLAVSSRYKTEFLANMSHELRTPLNSLLVLAKLLTENSEGNLTPQQVEFARTIHGAGSALLQLINDILDLSKVEAGRMDIHPQQISMPKLVEYVEATFGPLALDKGLSFSVYVDSAVPEEVRSDEQRLQQVLRNLLSNAVKFTPKGEVRLDITRASDVPYVDETLRGSDDILSFAVVDTGIGIAPEKLDVIFEQFRQADGTTSRKYGGTGLGLSICREIARLLGGEIHAKSEPGKGSTFTLHLPVSYSGPLANADGGAAIAPLDTPQERSLELTASDVLPELPQIAEEPPLPAPATWQGEDPLNDAKILIVDDDIRNVFALTSVLERHGATVVYAENGLEGIEQLERNEDVALVLMDIMMPEMDGWATTSAIRRMPQFADLPIIALTAKVMRGDREKSIASGASDYVPKPVDVDRLLERLRGWLTRGRVASGDGREGRD